MYSRLMPRLAARRSSRPASLRGMIGGRGHGLALVATNHHRFVSTSSYSFTSPESDFCGGIPVETLVSRPLPRTLADALQEDEDRAVVVTTASSPHTIVHVNQVWEQMCEFKKYEVLGQTLNILQGPDSNKRVAQTMLDRLTASQTPQQAYLLNYRKSGTSFINYLQTAPCYLNALSREPEFLVGVLQEVDRSQVPLQLSTL